MSTDFWHIHSDLEIISPKELIEQIWIDDELNRQRSLETFQDEAKLVNQGLEFFIGAIQGAMRSRSEWSGNEQLRAAIAMLLHAFNTYLVWRHLTSYGYLAETRLFARSIHESLTRALAFANDEQLANKFFEGQQISPKIIRNKLSDLFHIENGEPDEVFDRLNSQYRLLSTSSHPTLQSFALRTGAKEPGNEGLRRAVPEMVVTGGFLSDDIGRISWLGLARNIADSLSAVGKILIESSGNWATQTEQYRAEINQIIQEDEIFLDEQYPQ